MLVGRKQELIKLNGMYESDNLEYLIEQSKIFEYINNYFHLFPKTGFTDNVLVLQVKTTIIILLHLMK